MRKRPRDNQEEQPPEVGALARREAAQVPAEAASGPPRVATLEFLSGDRKGEAVHLDRIVTLIGRDESCDIVVPDDTVSREHGQIEQALGRWIYTNFSENGTWINRKSAERVVLSDGDTVAIGAKTRLKFRLETAAQAEVAPVVRRRARRTREEIAAEEEAAEAQQPAATIGESLKKRRGLVIGLAVYLALMAGVFLVLAMTSSGNGPGGSTDADQIYEKEDLKDWLDGLEFNLPRDDALRQARITQAERLLSNKQWGQPMDLFNAIRCLIEAKEYGGGILDWEQRKALDAAKVELVDELYLAYLDGVVAQRDRKDYAAARKYYDQILSRLPSWAPFHRHVMARLRQM